VPPPDAELKSAACAVAGRRALSAAAPLPSGKSNATPRRPRTPDAAARSTRRRWAGKPVPAALAGTEATAW